MGKKGKRKKRKEKAWYGRVWFQAAGILAVLALIAGVLFVVLQPPDPHSLYARAKKLMESSKSEDHDKANAEDGPIANYLNHYASLQNDETKQLLAWRQQYAVEQDEAMLQDLVGGRRIFKDDPNAAPKEKALAAAKAEESGDVAGAIRLWQDMKEKYVAGAGHEDWGVLADAHRTSLLDPEKLYGQAKKLMESSKSEDHEKACADSGPIKTYLEHFASRPGDQTKQVLAWKKQCAAEQSANHDKPSP